MGVFDFLRGGGPREKGGTDPLINKETRTYDDLIDEIMSWNINHTDIMNVLRSEIKEERLSSWSYALETGVRRGLTSPYGRREENPLFPIFLDLYQFVKGLRPKLLKNPTMKNVKETKRLDPLFVCIICGIRALQKEKGTKRLINTLQWKLLERYLG